MAGGRLRYAGLRSLKVWDKAHALALETYRATANFPKSELYGLTSQIRRGVVSVAANIAEGCGRGSDVDFKRFLQMAMGSACEVEYELLLARDLAYLDTEWHGKLQRQLIEIKRMLSALIQRLRGASG